MGTEYTAWIGTPTQCIKEVEFFKHYELASWLRYLPEAGDYITCVHPGCELSHRVGYPGFDIRTFESVKIDLEAQSFIRWTLKRQLPSTIDDPYFEEAVQKLDEPSDYERSVEDCLKQIAELADEMSSLKKQMSWLKSDYYYPDWPEERIELVKNMALWMYAA